ncbi:MAG: hypothetical protein U1E78_02795 [Gammaproteobacteria bacterium]
MLTGCPSAFQPPQETIFLWKKRGTTYSEIENEMLDCGYPSAAGAKPGTDKNEVALMQLCIQKKGYRFAIEKGTFCDIYPNLPACVEARSKKGRSNKE